MGKEERTCSKYLWVIRYKGNIEGVERKSCREKHSLEDILSDVIKKN